MLTDMEDDVNEVSRALELQLRHTVECVSFQVLQDVAGQPALATACAVGRLTVLDCRNCWAMQSACMTATVKASCVWKLI